mmetsp:Transcript_935/g.1266  ORF Transcript_935/g.1266 Transcript_935/m.1266 type:complete len:273 (-) Transcript_935:44-862(-)
MSNVFVLLCAFFIAFNIGRRDTECGPGARIKFACDAATCDNPNPNPYCDTPVPQCVCNNPRKVLDKKNNRCVKPRRCPSQCGEGQEIQQLCTPKTCKDPEGDDIICVTTTPQCGCIDSTLVVDTTNDKCIKVEDCPSDPIACTQDVFQCPDGSFVSRDPNNNCQFFPCPTVECREPCPAGFFCNTANGICNAFKCTTTTDCPLTDGQQKSCCNVNTGLCETAIETVLPCLIPPCPVTYNCRCEVFPCLVPPCPGQCIHDPSISCTSSDVCQP